MTAQRYTLLCRGRCPAGQHRLSLVPAWAPDGDRIAFVHMARDGTRELRVLDTRTRLSTPVAGVQFARLTELHWHPTAPRLTFAAQSDGRYDVYVVRIDRM